MFVIKRNVFGSIATAIAAVALFSVAHAGFDPPAVAPPGGNVDVPIYSVGAQTLTGNFIVTTTSGTSIQGGGGTTGIYGLHTTPATSGLNALYGNVASVNDFAGRFEGGKGIIISAADKGIDLTGILQVNAAGGQGIEMINQDTGILWPDDTGAALFGIYVKSSNDALRLVGHGGGVEITDKALNVRLSVSEAGNVLISGDLTVSGGGAFGGYTPSATHKVTTPTLYAEQAQIGDPTGGLKGAGSINTSSLCIDGVCKADWTEVGGVSGWTYTDPVVHLTTPGDTVGVGTSSLVNGKLNIQDSATQLAIYSNDYASGVGEAAYLKADAGIVSLNVTKTGWSAYGDVILANDGGNAGIGTITPNAKLGVAPDVNTEGLRIVSSNYSPLIVRNTADTADLHRVDQSGNATSAGYVSDVSGLVGGNYVPSHSWTISTGSVGIFSQNGATSENSREWGIGPHGNRAILWKGGNDAASDADGGWNSSAFSIDHTKTYRYSIWLKRTGSANGTAYLGAYGSALTYLNGSGEGNPYFYCGGLPTLDKWYLLIGYIHASGDSSTTSYGGMYDGVTGRKVISFNGETQCSTDYKFTTSATVQAHRTYLYYSTDTNVRQYFWDPRVEEVSGKEPTIEALLGIPKSATANNDAYFGGDLYVVDNKSVRADANQDTNLIVGNYNGDGGAFTYGGTYDMNIAVEGDVKGDRLCIEEDCKASWAEIVGAGGGGYWTLNGSDLYPDTSYEIGIGTASPGTKAEIYRLETSGRQTYTDLLTVSAAANTSPYNGHGGGILFRGTDYWDAAGELTNLARIGATINDNSIDRYGPDLFFDVAPLDDGSLSRAMTIKYTGNVAIGGADPGAYRLSVQGGPVYMGAGLNVETYLAMTASSRIAINGSAFGNGNVYGVGNGAAYNNLNSIAVDTVETDGGVGGAGTLELVYYGGTNVKVGSGGTKPIYASQFLDGSTGYYADPAGSNIFNGVSANNLLVSGVANCSGKLYTDVDGNVLCGADASGTSYWTLNGSDLYTNTSYEIGIGTTAPTNPLEVNSATDSQIKLLKTTTADTAFGVLAWDSDVYLSAGVYYDGSAWVHKADGNDNQLLDMSPGDGMRWYASNNGSGSWNVASSEQLWKDSGEWTNVIQSTASGTSYFTGGSVAIGTINPGSYTLYVDGDIAASGDVLARQSADLAEEFSSDAEIEYGTVVVMGDSGAHSVKPSEIAYDKTVVGIISEDPAIIMSHAEGAFPAIVALAGVVKVKVIGPIEKGDLLVSSNVLGYAMATNEFKMGTIIGKAMEPLDGEKGEIMMLVMLQ